MSTQDALQIKEKIISIFKIKGPCLPVNIAKETGLSILFASAFLSEFLSEKKIKISNMKVGGSPLYFIPGQETMLEKFSNYLKSKEKEAFDLLKEKNILKDINQEPSIRVALREIKDFAIPFKKDGEIYWRYFNFSEKEIRILEENKKEEKPVQKNVKKKISLRKPRKNEKNEKFFEEVKNFLKEKNLELVDIKGIGKKELTLLVKEGENKKILVAHDKKRINEKDISNASKKANEFNLQYILLSKGGPLKKVRDLIDAVKNLDSIGNL